MRAVLTAFTLAWLLAACGGGGSPGTPPVQVAPGVTAAPTSAPAAGGSAAPATPASDYQENYGY